MKQRYLLLLAVLLAGCAPASQSDIFSSSANDMNKAAQKCAAKTAHKKNMHVAAVNCRFDADEVILGNKGFEEYNDLLALKKHFIYIARKQDAREISKAKAMALSQKYTGEFFKALQHHDMMKSRGYNIMFDYDTRLVAYGLGLGLQAAGTYYQAQANAYNTIQPVSPAPVYVPSYVPAQDNYTPPQPTRCTGAMGYNAVTGSTCYTPAIGNGTGATQ